MQFVDIPEFPRLRGQEAIKALYDLVDELEEHRGEELTDKQTTALIRFARGLISSIECARALKSIGKTKGNLLTGVYLAFTVVFFGEVQTRVCNNTYMKTNIQIFFSPTNSLDSRLAC